MSEAPERIWARHVAHYGLDDLELGCWWHTPEYGDEVEYVRADRIEQLAAINEALEAKLAMAVEALQTFKDFDDLPLECKRPDVFQIKVREPILVALAKLKREKE